MHIITQILLEFLKMIWEISWGLAFGFMLSSVIRAYVPTETISSRLGKNSIAAAGLSTFFGAISSSCSYAAASMARTLVIKGATWSNAIAFLVSSTNLVFEIFIVVVTLLGWSFFGGEVIGGILFIIIASLLIVKFFSDKISSEAEDTAKTLDEGGNDSHADHYEKPNNKGNSDDTAKSDKQKASFKEKLMEAAGYFYMDVNMVGKDILIGIALSSIIMVVVPGSFWKYVFLTKDTSLPHFVMLAWNALAGILIGIFAFVCSVGNIVLASVLWKGGISFGGVIAFILSDLITFPMLMVYRKYFGVKTMWYLLVILGVSIFCTALIVDYSFQAFHWVPKTPHPTAQAAHWQFKWDYATWLSLFFIPASVIYFFYGKRNMKM